MFNKKGGKGMAGTQKFLVPENLTPSPNPPSDPCSDVPCITSYT